MVPALAGGLGLCSASILGLWPVLGASLAVATRSLLSLVKQRQGRGPWRWLKYGPRVCPSSDIRPLSCAEPLVDISPRRTTVFKLPQWMLSKGAGTVHPSPRSPPMARTLAEARRVKVPPVVEGRGSLPKDPAPTGRAAAPG
jgi:hypothetical protein